MGQRALSIKVEAPGHTIQSNVMVKKITCQNNSKVHVESVQLLALYTFFPKQSGGEKSL